MLIRGNGNDGPIKEKGTTVYALADGISTVEFSYCDEDGIVAKITINISISIPKQINFKNETNHDSFLHL